MRMNYLTTDLISSFKAFVYNLNIFKVRSLSYESKYRVSIFYRAAATHSLDRCEGGTNARQIYSKQNY